MEMLNKQRIAPRVQVMELRSRYTGIQLSKSELDRVLYALEKSGVKDAFSRLINDSVRFALDELVEGM